MEDPKPLFSVKPSLRREDEQAHLSFWEMVKLLIGAIGVKLGLLSAHLMCEKCGREVEPDNWERHQKVFHPEN